MTINFIYMMYFTKSFFTNVVRNIINEYKECCKKEALSVVSLILKKYRFVAMSKRKKNKNVRYQ